MTLDDPVVASLERLAETAGDVSQEIFALFAAHEPESAALMRHMDDYMLGRMMQDVLVLLMTPPDDLDRHYLTFEVESHRAYGVTPEMFPPLLEAVCHVARTHLGEAWSRELELAWNRRIDEINAAIGCVARAPSQEQSSP